MALIEQQNVIFLGFAGIENVPEKVLEHLQIYPDVRIVSLQVISYPERNWANVVLVVETI